MADNDKETQPKAAFYDADGKPMSPKWVLGLQSLYGVTPDGKVSRNARPYLTDGLTFPIPRVLPNDEDKVTLETGGNTKLEWHPGSGILLGKPNTGKSLLINTLVARNGGDAQLIRYREPEIDSLLYERDFVVRMVAALESNAKLICVDSLRTTFYASTGATGRGGVNMGIFELVTAYDLIAKVYGKVILFALNPTSTDAEAIQSYLDAATGSVTHTLSATTPTRFDMSTRSASDRGWTKHHYAPVSKKGERVKQTRAKYVQMHEDGIADLYTFTTNSGE